VVSESDVVRCQSTKVDGVEFRQ